MWKQERPTHHKDRIYSNCINNATAIIKHNCQSSARTQTEPDIEWKSSETHDGLPPSGQEESPSPWSSQINGFIVLWKRAVTIKTRKEELTCDISITWPHLHISITWPPVQWGHEEEVGSILLFLKRWNGDCLMNLSRWRGSCWRKSRFKLHWSRQKTLLLIPHVKRRLHQRLEAKNTCQAKNSREKPNYDLREKGILHSPAVQLKILLICKETPIWWC